MQGAERITPPPIFLPGPLPTRICSVPPNRKCTVEWWDTTKRHIIRKEQAATAIDGLTLNLPDLTEDMALKIRW